MERKEQLEIGIIDADLLDRTNHRFPNLVCEKLSGYWKEKGAQTHLLFNYDNLDAYDEVYVSKVFTDTPVPDFILDDLNRPSNIHIGGTGFYFDKAPNLPDEIEHHMPDYKLYDEYIDSVTEKARAQKEAEGKRFNERSWRQQFREYKEYSIGFLTRGCFRKCGFCVNKKYDHVFPNSPLNEFYDPSRRRICLLDDNFFGCPKWRDMMEDLIATGRPFKFKQGLDARLLTDDICKILFNVNYDGDYTFAFDSIRDYDLIKSKLKLIRKYTSSTHIKFYVLVGYESTDAQDIENAFKRIALLMEYGAEPYVMRYRDKNDTPWKRSEFSDMYIQMARWCNQPSLYKKMSFREFVIACQAQIKTQGRESAPMKALNHFEHAHPDIAKKYFDLHYVEFCRGEQK